MNKIVLLNICVWLALAPSIARCSATFESTPVPVMMQNIMHEKISDILLPTLLNDFSKKAIINANKVVTCWSSASTAEKESGGALAALAELGSAQAHAARALRELQLCRAELAKTQAELKLLKATQSAAASPTQHTVDSAAAQATTKK